MKVAKRSRCALLVLVVLLAATAIGARLYQLQVQHRDRFRTRAEDQHRREVVVQATRGAILDRHGRELAMSLETQSLFAHPWRVEDPELAAAMLSSVIDVPHSTLLRRLRSEKPFVYLRRFLDPQQVAAVRRLDLPIGENQPFGFSGEAKRFYPRGKLAVHVIGYATIDGDGVEGIEKQFDRVLKGDPTVYLAQRDARNGQLLQLIRGPERESRAVVLSLDVVLQHVVERELDRAMVETGARAASAILLDPSTGEVLALANRPSADLSHYGRATDEQRKNRALVNYFEPGSTFKIVTMAAVLERGRVRMDERFDCENGLLTIGRRRIRDTRPHALLTPPEILAKSSNIGMVKVVQRLEARELFDTIERFGFGRRTGIELPGESEGLLHTVSRWSGLSQSSLSFGQEVGVTALQLVTAMSTIANDGVQIRPRVVLATRDAEGRHLPLERPAPRRVIPVSVAHELRDMLELVIASGTGRRAAVPSYRLAGKSGTAQIAIKGGGYSDTDYTASFGGFGPSRSPRLVGLVVLDSPLGDRHQGGQVAAPTFSRIMADALRHLHAPTDGEARLDTLAVRASPEPPRREPVERPTAPGTVPDVRGLSLREAVSTLAEHGYRAQIQGNGSVTAQRPAAGSPLEPGRPCTLSLGRSRRRRPAGAASGTGRTDG
jgi:cell division protein FtsI/penicillin-binding protein 2